MSDTCYCRGDNPGPWSDDEGIWFEVGAQTFGPFDTEDEAETAFADALEAFEAKL